MVSQSPELARWLGAFLQRHGGVAGTVHLRRGETLHLAAAVNIPPQVQEITARIPRGKGMAGLALERGEPVQTCNLKVDASGDVQPGARAVDARAAVALPVAGEDGAIRAVVGVAFAEERELSAAEVRALAAASAELPQPVREWTD